MWNEMSLAEFRKRTDEKIADRKNIPCLFGGNIGGILNDAYPGFSEYFLDAFNYATIGCFWKDNPDLGFAVVKAVANWCHDREIVTKGHASVYALTDLRPAALTGKTLTAISNWKPYIQAVRAALSQPRYLDYLDVVNEPLHISVASWSYAYLWAGKESLRLVNEYGVFTGETGFAAKYYSAIKTAGSAVDVIGIQAHCSADGPLDYDLMYSELTRFSKLGKPIHITEVSVPSAAGQMAGSMWTESLQAEHVERVYRMALMFPAVSGITYWMLAGDTWSPTRGLIDWVNGVAQPKPAYYTVQSMKGLLS